MLPKPEKIKKSISSESDNSDQPSPSDKIKTKRLVLVILIGLTVGLSLAFSLYHFLKTTRFSLPKFSTTSISVSTDPLENQLKAILGADYSNWSFTVQSNSSPPFFWSSSPSSSPVDFPTVSAVIDKLKQPVDPSILSVFPQGLKIIGLNSSNRIQLIIVTPKDQIYLDLSGPISTEKLKSILPAMYWSAVPH